MEDGSKKTKQLEGTETFPSPRTPQQAVNPYASNPYDVIAPPPPNYSNPYEHASPYSGPMPQPALKSKKRAGNILLPWIIVIVGLLLIASIIFFGINGLPLRLPGSQPQFTSP